MSQQQTPQSNLFGHIGHWLKRRDDAGEQNPARGHSDEHDFSSRNTPLVSGTIEPASAGRSAFLRAWAKRDAAIANLQEGFNTLTDLIETVRQGLDKSASRQDELLRYLAHLPEALQSIPEGHRQQSETLKAIGDQLASQNSQTAKLAEILERVSAHAGDQRQVLHDLQDRVETINGQDQAIADKMKEFGVTMSDVSKTSTASTQALIKMRDNLDSRDGSLERVLEKQGARMTLLLTIAIFLAVAALIGVGIVAWLLLARMK